MVERGERGERGSCSVFTSDKALETKTREVADVMAGIVGLNAVMAGIVGLNAVMAGIVGLNAVMAAAGVGFCSADDLGSRVAGNTKSPSLTMLWPPLVEMLL